MHTAKDLKKRYIDYLMTVDLKKLDIQSLVIFGHIVRYVDEMEISIVEKEEEEK